MDKKKVGEEGVGANRREEWGDIGANDEEPP